ncbi:NADH:ubiquinone reductase (Na(+)-transporting) subunit C [Hugenholtzia roseola]|uniref:NADH:ubiquinone reductase (Na(+)-transporting) subunit C n=1 Tax=Hugenholtzia roseola TaxID=1002 RepID=UPI000417C7D7|nr:NADH:ubiquinone reductase (Na(+)-transporting) subunit C [Hugenholtzia roseola]
MQHSNGYIIGFIVALTLICGSLLALANVGLKPFQTEAQDLDTKKQILSAVVDDVLAVGDVNAYYSTRIEAIAVDANGDPIAKDAEGKDLVVEKINVYKEFKEKDVNKKRFPVFKYKNEKGEVEAYILPVYGNGLWDVIWGYVALKPDLKTILGVSFGHKSETPGLGARISDKDIQNRYQGKSIYDEAGALVAVTMIKGENNPESALSQNKVDGMAGATITGVGVNNMLKNYMSFYQNYFEKEKKATQKPTKAIEIELPDSLNLQMADSTALTDSAQMQKADSAAAVQ